MSVLLLELKYSEQPPLIRTLYGVVVTFLVIMQYALFRKHKLVVLGSLFLIREPNIFFVLSTSDVAIIAYVLLELRRLKLKLSIFKEPLPVFLIYLILSSLIIYMVTSNVPLESLKNFYVIELLLFYFFIRSVISHEKVDDFLLEVSRRILLLFSFSSLWLFIRYGPEIVSGGILYFTDPTNYYFSSIYRSYFSFYYKDVNYFVSGLILITGIYLVLISNKKNSSSGRKAIYIFLPALFTFLSLSRTGVLVLSLLLFLYLVLTKMSSRILIIGVVCLILITSLSIGLLSNIYHIFEVYKQRFAKIGEDPRITIFKSSIRYMNENADKLIFGVGRMNMKKELERYLPFSSHIGHNDFLTIIFENGLIGFFLFMMIHATIMVKVLRSSSLKLIIIYCIWLFPQFVLDVFLAPHSIIGMIYLLMKANRKGRLIT